MRLPLGFSNTTTRALDPSFYVYTCGASTCPPLVQRDAKSLALIDAPTHYLLGVRLEDAMRDPGA